MDLARAGAAWRTVSGQVARHRRLVVAALTGIAVLSALHALRPSAPPTRPVWVAAHDLPGGEPLAATDLRTERLPIAAVPHDAVSSAVSLTGRLLAAPMRAGEPLTDVRLLSASLLTAADAPGDVAVPVRVSDGPAAVALVEVGDEIDILTSADATDGDPGPAPATGPMAIDDVRVLAIPSRGDPATSGADAANGDLVGVLIVAATPRQAADLAMAASSSRLTVALAELG